MGQRDVSADWGLKPLALAAGCGLAVFASDWLAIEFTRADTGRLAAIWLANAILLTILMKNPPRTWRALFAGAFVGNVLANLFAADTAPLAFGLAAINMLEVALVAVPLWWLFPRDLDLSRLKHLGSFTLAGGIVAPAVAGALAAVLLRIETRVSFVDVWTEWYRADALGYLVLVPLALMLRLDEVKELFAPCKRRRTLGWGLALLAITTLVFSQNAYPLLFLPLAVLAFIAVELGAAGTAIGIGFVAVVAIAATVAGHGPMMLVSGGLAARIVILQSFVAVTVISKLPLSAILSDRTRFEQQARGANRLLVLAEEIARIGHWSVDIRADEMTWSDGVYRIHGLDPRTYKPTLEAEIGFYHPDDRAEIAQWVQRTIEGSLERDISARLVRHDGSVRDVVLRGRCERNASGGVETIVGTIMDVTELRQAERDVVESEARYRLLADNTTDMITHLDLDGRYVFVSPGSRGLLGYEPEELIGLGSETMAHPDEAEALRGLSADFRLGRIERTVKTARLLHKDGRWVWTEASSRLLRDRHGRPEGFVVALRDVAERVRRDQQLREAKLAAESGARVKAEFLANMSHELRTPLTGILGVHDLLTGDPSLSDSQRRFVELARDSGRALLTIVNDILDFSKIEAGQLAIESVPFSCRDVVESCRQLGSEGLKLKSVTLEATVTDDVPASLSGDPTRLRQVLLNLLTNAIKFTAEGHIGVTASWSEGRLRVAVSDSGIGIKAEVIPHLFERFSQADGSTTRRFGGTGLGLSICKSLVELMGGTIGVDSTPGEGSTFWFELPLAIANVTLAPAHAEPGPACAEKSRRILLAEDNLTNQEIVATILAQNGHDVTCVGDGFSALTTFRTGEFDVVLMDVQMPVMDGIAASQAIRAWEAAERRTPVPIVALTANAMVEETQRCRQAGMDAHVAKPVVWAQLFATLDRLCGGADVQAALDDRSDEKPDEASVSPILDESALEDLTAFLDRGQIASLLASFRTDLEGRLGFLQGAEALEPELGRHVHALISLAGQLGFQELSEFCISLDQKLPVGGTRERITSLQTVAVRALHAAAATRYAKAA